MDNINTIIEKINNRIGDKYFYYISNYIDHAQGYERWIKNFKGICLWKTPYSEYLSRKGVEVFCYNDKRENQLDSKLDVKSSAQILDSIIDQNLISFEEGNFFQTFKISPRFSTLVDKLKGYLINTSDDLNRLFESKVSQAEIFDKYKINFPKTIIIKLKDLNYQDAVNLFGENFVIQFNRGHTGNGTIFVKSKEQYLELQMKFPQRILRISEFINSNTYTVNGCLTKNGVFLSGLCRQISGIPELSTDMGGTVGNNYAHGLNSSQILSLMDEVKKVEVALNAHNYRGLFGLDFMIQGDSIVLLEINARQTMSVPFNSTLQESKGQVPLILLHIVEFLDIDFELDRESYNMENTLPFEAAQLILRNKSNKDIEIKNEFKSGEYTIDGSNLVLRNPGLYIDKIEKDNLVINTKSKGTRISQGDEMARIQIKKNLYLDLSTLDSHYVNLLLQIEERLLRH